VSYDRLIAEHMRIQFKARSLWARTAMAEPDGMGAVLALADLALELGAHLTYEDCFVYPRMIAAENTEMAETAARFAREFAELRDDWTAFLEKWEPRRICADWDDFRVETHAILTRLAARIDSENELLYPAALRNGVIRLRSAA